MHTKKFREFLRNLDRVKDQFRWTIRDTDGAVRADLDGLPFCPLTAVYFSVRINRGYMPLTMFASAGAGLGLKECEWKAVINAIDNAAAHDKTIRSAILNAIGRGQGLEATA